MLTVGRNAAIEPEVDLHGYWLDGDLLHVGEIRVGAAATIGARATLLPGTFAELGDVGEGQQAWSVLPAVSTAKLCR